MAMRFKLVKTVDGGTVLIKASNMPPAAIKDIVDSIAINRGVTLYKKESK